MERADLHGPLTTELGTGEKKRAHTSKSHFGILRDSTSALRVRTKVPLSMTQIGVAFFEC